MGSGKLIGTPEQVAEGLLRLQEAGLDGVGLTFRHVTEELAEALEPLSHAQKSAITSESAMSLYGIA